jgi:hypothetical protein
MVGAEPARIASLVDDKAGSSTLSLRLGPADESASVFTAFPQTQIHVRDEWGTGATPGLQAGAGRSDDPCDSLYRGHVQRCADDRGEATVLRLARGHQRTFRFGQAFTFAQRRQ